MLENYVSTRREYAAAPQEYVRSSPEYALTSQRDPYREFESYGQPPRRGSRVRQVVSIINLALFVAIVTGLSLFLYFDYQQGAHSLIFGSHGSAATTAATSTSAADAPAKAPAASVVTPAETAAQAPAVAPPAAIAAATYEDPLPFCSAVQTIDAPDPRYVGPKLPPVIAAALQIPISSPPDQIHWRCLNSTLMGCMANNTHRCDVTPTVKEMVSYCNENPGAKDLPAPNGTWFCSGATPVIPKDQKWPVDARGFYPDAWILVPPAGTAPPAG